jgi:hypothetical protein
LRIVNHADTEWKVGGMKRAHRMVFNLASVAGVLTSLVAALTIWLLLAQPLSVTSVRTTSDLPALAQALAAVISRALSTILGYF